MTYVFQSGKYATKRVTTVPTDYLKSLIRNNKIEYDLAAIYDELARRKKNSQDIFDSGYNQAMPYGKYRYWKFQHIPTDYLEWMLNNVNDIKLTHYAHSELIRRKKGGQKRPPTD